MIPLIKLIRLKIPTTCEVTFENNAEKICYAGQMIYANVRLNLEKEKKVRGVYVIFKGYSCAAIQVGRTRFKGKEVYLNEKTYFIHNDDGKLKLIKLLKIC